MKSENARLADWAWGLEIPASEKLVLLALLRHRNNATGLCYPSHATLARWTRLSRRSVIRAVASLRARGMLEAEDRPGTSALYSMEEGVTICHRGCDTVSHEQSLNHAGARFGTPEADLQDRSLTRWNGPDGCPWPDQNQGG